VRIAHLADLHLGYRAYTRETPQGQNQREADVQLAVRRAFDGVIAQAPDVVLLAGDVFHSVRPDNRAIVALFAELQRLRTALPKVDVVAIAGDHDTPRTSSTGTILSLYRALGVHTVERDIALVPLPSGLTVLCVPQARARQLKAYTGPPGDVLLLHGEVRQVPGANVDPTVLEGHPWQYVALGHYHVCAEVGTRAWYAGSLDYTSTDPWSERARQLDTRVPGKGWLLVELGYDPAFMAIEPPRRFEDLLKIDAADMTAEELNTLLAELAADVDGAVVRQVVVNLSRETHRAGLDHEAIRSYKRRALNYHLSWSRPAAQAPTPEARARVRQTLDEVVAQFFGERPLPPDVDRGALTTLAAEHLAAVGTDPYTGAVTP